MGCQMAEIIVQGGHELGGQLYIQGSKNAVLPILAATILTRETCFIHHAPEIEDVHVSLRILSELGGCAEKKAHMIRIKNSDLMPEKLSPALASRMRSSILFSGACLSAFGYARLEKPGGCVIGERPIDMHLQCFSDMGAKIEEREECTVLTAEHLHGAHHVLRLPSVGVTENILLAAVLAEGNTIIENAAREPEVVTLCRVLRKAGALIWGEGSNRIEIVGVPKLHGFTCYVPGDRIVAATYICAVLAAKGMITLRGVPVWQLRSFLTVVRKMGAEVFCTRHTIFVKMTRRPFAIPDLQTGYFPKLSTDTQSLLLVPLCLSSGEGVVEENIFENRFRIVPELKRMGAQVETDSRCAIYKGVGQLVATSLEAKELRGGAALVIAALAADGESRIDGISYIERGYEDIVGDLQKLGAKLEYAP